MCFTLFLESSELSNVQGDPQRNFTYSTRENEGGKKSCEHISVKRLPIWPPFRF